VVASVHTTGRLSQNALPGLKSVARTTIAPAEALAACTVNAAHVLGRAGSIGRLAPGYQADVALLDAEDWRHLAYHFAGDLVHTVVERGAIAWSRA
jgi:imidazolonepropionase